MKIKKGTLLQISHTRRGTFKGEANRDFDTEKDEWYPIILIDDIVWGLNTSWKKGEEIPCRRNLSKLKVLEEK